MKQLTICTHLYSQLLRNFTTHAQNCDWLAKPEPNRKDGLHTVYCQYNNAQAAFAKGLMTLLAEIAVQENPIYQHSPKLQDMAYDLRKTPLYAAELRGLIRFLKHNRTLHLEGYVAFRMADYREKLDMMSYSLIKKLNFNRQD